MTSLGIKTCVWDQEGPAGKESAAEGGAKWECSCTYCCDGCHQQGVPILEPHAKKDEERAPKKRKK